MAHADSAGLIVAEKTPKEISVQGALVCLRSATLAISNSRCNRVEQFMSDPSRPEDASTRQVRETTTKIICHTMERSLNLDNHMLQL